MIHQGSDVGSEEDDVGINNLNRGKGATLVEFSDEGENLITVPYFRFDVDEVG
jgi:hypothetical protein